MFLQLEISYFHSTPGIYLTITMGMTSMSIILTVFVLQLHHVGPHKRPVPGWLNTIVVGLFARLVCMSRDSQPFKQHRLTVAPSAPTSRHTVAVRVESDLPVHPPINHRGFRCIESSQSFDNTGGQCSRRSDDHGGYSLHYGRDNNSEHPDNVEETMHSKRLINTLDFARGRPNCNGDGFAQQVTPSSSTRRLEEQDTCYSPLIPHSQCTLFPPAPSSTAQSSVACPLYSEQVQQNILTDSFHFSQRQGSLQNSPKPRLSFLQAGLMSQAGCMEGPALERYQQLVLEWQFVAHVMDRLLFWLFLVLAIVCSLSILVIKPLFKPEL